MQNENFINREISWLSFNARVLQEAKDENVPLLERLKFLAIFSNNLDEFFKVRVATLRRMAKVIKKEDVETVAYDPKELLTKIQEIVLNQYKEFDKIYKSICKRLKKENIVILDETMLSDIQKEFVKQYFIDKIKGHLFPIIISDKKNIPSLSDKNTSLYSVLRGGKNNYVLTEIPSHLSRFIVLPETEKGRNAVILLEDVIRAEINELFPNILFESSNSYTIKVNRDAELDIDNDVSESIIDALERSIKLRSKGEVVRLIYDETLPEEMLSILLNGTKLKKTDNLIPGARYHNFKDFFNFPDFGRKELLNTELSPSVHPALKNNDYFSSIAQKDILLHFPSHSFESVIDWIKVCAMDDKVTHIYITLYRVSQNSRIIKALIQAAKNGKRVKVIIEPRARFDEKENLDWAQILHEEGVHVTLGVNGLKVHSKLCLVRRMETKTNSTYYAFISTGNFHEGTANIYSDLGIFTANQAITKEVKKVFNFFRNNYQLQTFKHLLVAPFNLRSEFEKLINTEIQKGENGFIFLKTNNLVDKKMIRLLYNASKVGVKIKLIIRGICSLKPQVKGLSENIEVISIIDRFLEHSRVFIFGNERKTFIGSADWMTRNLDYRCEVIVPILDETVKEELNFMMRTQWNDNQKARIINENAENNYKIDSEKALRSQMEIDHYFKSKDAK